MALPDGLLRTPFIDEGGQVSRVWWLALQNISASADDSNLQDAVESFLAVNLESVRSVLAETRKQETDNLYEISHIRGEVERLRFEMDQLLNDITLSKFRVDDSAPSDLIFPPASERDNESQGPVMHFGTISSQNAHQVEVTGGTVGGLSSFGVRSSGTGAFDLKVANTENLTATRTVTLKTNDAGRTIDLAGNLTLAGALATSGANSLTLTTTGSTNVTLPTSGTLTAILETQSYSSAPYIDSATAGSGRSTTVNHAKWTRIGNICFVSLRVTMATLGSGGSGNVRIKNGLPFTCISDSGNYLGGMDVPNYENLSTGVRTISASAYPGSTDIAIYITTADNAANGQMDFATYIQATTQFYVTGFYVVA